MNPPAKGKAVFYCHYLAKITKGLAAPTEPGHSLQMFTAISGKVSQHRSLPLCVNHYLAYVYSATTLKKWMLLKDDYGGC